MSAVFRAGAAALTFCLFCFALTTSAASEEDARLEAFLEATGFDIALESLKLSAENAPQMIGMQADDFGVQWTAIVEEVFETELLHVMAVDILRETLDTELLTHAVDFYTSDLGLRLVDVENASHMKDNDDLKFESGQAIVAGLVRIGSPRLEELKRLVSAVGSEDASVHAIQEVQVRFLMAAATAGVIDLPMDEEDLRASLKRQEGDMRRTMQIHGLASAAYTYQAFDDAEITAYADALEHPDMQKVYALMNAVQFEIMADRYEVMARKMRNLQGSQEL